MKMGVYFPNSHFHKTNSHLLKQTPIFIKQSPIFIKQTRKPTLSNQKNKLPFLLSACPFGASGPTGTSYKSIALSSLNQ